MLIYSNGGDYVNVHEMDQALAGLADIAKLTRKYHESLVEEGFDNKEALQICAYWSASLVTGGK